MGLRTVTRGPVELGALAAVLVLVCASVAVGCDAFGFAQASAKTRAASDFSCDKSKLEAVEIGNHSFKVSGCAQTATYTCIRGEGVGEGQWACLREK